MTDTLLTIAERSKGYEIEELIWPTLWESTSTFNKVSQSAHITRVSNAELADVVGFIHKWCICITREEYINFLGNSNFLDA